jgi:hypothetical protein
MNLTEVVKDKRFRSLVAKGIEELLDKRSLRPLPPKGYRYKRDVYDHMKSEDMLSTEFFLDNILDIWDRKSSISSQPRGVIEYICTNALQQFTRPNEEKGAKDE